MDANLKLQHTTAAEGDWTLPIIVVLVVIGLAVMLA